MNSLYATLYIFGLSVRERGQKLRERASEDRGATAIEYGLLVGLIAVVIITAVTALGLSLNGMFESVNDSLPAPAEG